jgi:hypothetical protein
VLDLHVDLEVHGSDDIEHTFVVQRRTLGQRVVAV